MPVDGEYNVLRYEFKEKAMTTRQQQQPVEAVREHQVYVVYYHGEPLVRVNTPLQAKVWCEELAHREDEQVQR